VDLTFAIQPGREHVKRVSNPDYTRIYYLLAADPT